MMIIKQIFLFLSLVVVCVIVSLKGARILGAVFTPSYSHQVTFHPLWKALSLKGHELIVLTTDPIKNKSLINLTEIDLSTSYDIMDAHNASNILSRNDKNLYEKFNLYINALCDTVDHQLSNKYVKNLINNQSIQFDLLIIEVIFPTHMAFASRFKVPFIGLTSLDAPTRIHEALGNPTHPILYPDYQIPFYNKLNFFQRLICVIFYFINMWISRSLYNNQDLLIKKHFGDNTTLLNDIQNNMSLLFMNVNPIFHNIRPLNPNTILIGGGIHFKELQPLPMDLKLYLDSANDGFIYFNLGSNVHSNALDSKFKRTILEVFLNLPYKILWKFEDDKLTNLSKNIKTFKWIPQQDVLRHHNIKVFITQCGLQSIEEAILSHVPMIGLPFFGDQHSNCKIIEEKHLGVCLETMELTTNQLNYSINQIVNNNKFYNENIKFFSKLYKDQDISSLEKAIWWTEYLIRYKSAEHLRNTAKDYPFYQYFFLDIVFFLIFVFFLIYLILKQIYKMTLNIIKIKQD